MDYGLKGVYSSYIPDSLESRAGYIPGPAGFTHRIAEEVLEKIRGDKFTFVLMPPDGILAKLAVAEVSHRGDLKVCSLDGGIAAWTDVGYARESADDPDTGELPEDIWYKPYQQTDAIEEAMHTYLTGQVALVEQIERDGTIRFLHFSH